MLGTQAQYSTQIKVARRYSWRKPIIVLALLLLVGAGGWWAYQMGIAGQALPGAAQMTNTSGQAAVGESPVLGSAGNMGTAAGQQVSTVDAASAAASQVAASGAAQSNAAQAAELSGQGASFGTNQIVLSGIAGVAGTPLWGDDGTLLATLESGSILTIKARTPDNAWLFVETETGLGWTQAFAVVAYGLHRLATTVLPEAVAPMSTQAEAAADTETASATLGDSAATTADLSLIDLVAAPASPADSSQLGQPADVQLTAKIAATGARLNVRSGPGTDYQVVAKAGDGAEYQAVGRNAEGNWLLLQLSDDGGDVGWVSASYVELSGDIQTLPVENA